MLTYQRIWAFAYLLLVVALIGLAVYTRQIDKAANQHTAALAKCVGHVVRVNTEGTQAKTAAADRKDRRELKRLEAMRFLVGVRVVTVEPGRAREWALAYDQASRDYEAELRNVIATRQAHPVPDFDKYCSPEILAESDDNPTTEPGRVLENRHGRN